MPYRAGSPGCHLFFGNFIGASGAAIRAEAFGKCGLFREGWEFAEDWELYLRLARRYRFAYLEFPLFVYRSHPGQAVVVTDRLEVKDWVAQVVESNLDLIGRMPESMRRKARVRVGQALRGRALASLKAGRTDGVVKHARGSLRYDPWRPDAVFYGLLGLLPAVVIRGAARAFRRLKHTGRSVSFGSRLDREPAAVLTSAPSNETIPPRGSVPGGRVGQEAKIGVAPRRCAHPNSAVERAPVRAQRPPLPRGSRRQHPGLRRSPTSSS